MLLTPIEILDQIKISGSQFSVEMTTAIDQLLAVLTHIDSEGSINYNPEASAHLSVAVLSIQKARAIIETD